MGMTVRTRVLVDGEAQGPALVLGTSLSLWGGLDAETGRIIDVHHPQHGASVIGRVLVMPSGRGSSSSSSILAEAIRLGTAPAAIVLDEPDGVLVVGALVAETLYGTTCPIVVIEDPSDRRRIGDGDVVSIEPGGVLSVA
jgi:predicted aconitase with swiveling domain